MVDKKYKRAYLKTDNYGTKYYSQEQPCTKCGGSGGWKGWPGFTCYRCGGSGIDPYNEVVKEYTFERRAQLDAQNAKRAAKKAEEQEIIRQEKIAQAEETKEKWLARKFS